MPCNTRHIGDLNNHLDFKNHQQAFLRLKIFEKQSAYWVKTGLVNWVYIDANNNHVIPRVSEVLSAWFFGLRCVYATV